MNQQVTIEEHPTTPEMAPLFEQAERNMTWLSEHAEELEIFRRHRSRYVAAAGGELFVADTPEEVERLAREKHPDEIHTCATSFAKCGAASMRNGSFVTTA